MTTRTSSTKSSVWTGPAYLLGRRLRHLLPDAVDVEVSNPSDEPTGLIGVRLRLHGETNLLSLDKFIEPREFGQTMVNQHGTGLIHQGEYWCRCVADEFVNAMKRQNKTTPSDSIDDKVTEEEKVKYPWLTDEIKKRYREHRKREMGSLMKSVEASAATRTGHPHLFN